MMSDAIDTGAMPGPAEWRVEGVLLCPGDCGLYLDFEGTPADLEKFISAHDCAAAAIGADFR